MKLIHMIFLAMLLVLSSCAVRITEELTYTPGFPGIDGANALINLVDAAGECENGGFIILTATDTDRSGDISALDTNVKSATLCNGVDGQSGEAGSNGLDAVLGAATPVALIDPCGQTPGYVNEVLLRLADGQILASFSDSASGLNTRFGITGAGSYMTTDGTGCYFNVGADGVVSW